MNQITKENIHKYIKKNFIGFDESWQVSRDSYYKDGEPLNYIIMGDFANYYIGKVEEKNKNEVTKIHNFLSQLLESEDNYLKTLLTVGFFESLNPNSQYYGEIEKSLPDNLITILKEVEKFWEEE